MKEIYPEISRSKEVRSFQIDKCQGEYFDLESKTDLSSKFC